MFVTLEGGEGAGKTTQAKMLHDYYTNQGKEVLLTREPGGSPLAEDLREVLMKHPNMDAEVEYLIITAARLDHVNKVIKPALAAGKVVICDRYLDSSIVYQSSVKGMDSSKLIHTYTQYLDNFYPDLTLIFDIDPQLAQERIDKNRFESEQSHYDKQGLEFHTRIRKAFLQLAQQDARYNIINAAEDPKTVHRQIVGLLSAQQITLDK
jgi:dTMP kinase